MVEATSLLVITLSGLILWALLVPRGRRRPNRVYRLFRTREEYEEWDKENCGRPCALLFYMSGCLIADDLAYSDLHDTGGVWGSTNTAAALGVPPAAKCPYFVTSQASRFELTNLVRRARAEARQNRVNL